MSAEWKHLPFQEAVEFFRDKLNMPTFRWNELWQEEHANAFTVAGALRTSLLEDLREGIDAAIADGISFNEWRNRFDDLLEKHTWEPKGGRPFRARVIFETNLRVANAVGRWQQIEDPDVRLLRPYLEYRHSGKKRGRPEHKAWNGLILRADDPFWVTHYPPNGWGCGCHVVTRSERDLKRMGRSGPDVAPPIEYYDWVDKQTGVITAVPKGIDPGWAYNVGMAKRGQRG